METERKTHHILLKGETRKDFESVFPFVFKDTDNRISLGAYREDGAILGALSFTLADNQYTIDWLYVIPEARRQGIATGLVTEFQEFMIHTGERYPVNARFPVTDEDVSVHRFFLSLSGADVAYSHERFFVTPENIRKAAPLHRNTADVAQTEKFFENREDWQKKTLRSLERIYGYTVTDYDTWKEDCVPELCLCLSVKSNLLCGIFVQRAAEHMLELSWLYGKYPQGLFQLLEKAAQEAESLYPEDTLTFEAVNEKSENLAKRLFPNARSVSIYEAGW